MINSISPMIGSKDPNTLADFYGKVLDVDPVYKDGEWTGYKIGDSYFMVGPHSDITGKNAEPARVMFNIEVDDLPKEYDRIKNLGAKVIKEIGPAREGDDGDIGTFEDPDGNYFQLMATWEE